MLHKQRENFEFLEDIVIKTIGKLPVTPNQWTILSVVIALVGLFFVYLQLFVLALIFFLLSLSLDYVDGAIARARDMASNSGAYLDTLADRYVEAIRLFGLLLIPTLPVIIFPSFFWIFLALFGSMITTYSKAATGEKKIAEEAVRKTLMSKGLLKVAERSILVLLIYIAIIFNQFYVAMYLLIILALFTNITAIRKIFKFIKYNKEIGIEKIEYKKGEKIIN
ncbi:MAG: CDP-alcohol phosphatidyltransferase family protein [Candidatus Paceibacterota bacterium]|jgi:phosphatidylglycerophosphate synthase